LALLGWGIKTNPDADQHLARSGCNYDHRRYDCWKTIMRLALLWYVAAILIWWLASGVVGALGPHNSLVEWLHDLGFGAALTAFFFIGWWLPYTSWLALGEFLFFRIYPHRKTPFVGFAVLSFVSYTTVALHYPNWSSTPELLIWPAAVATVIYLILRISRRARAVAA